MKLAVIPARGGSKRIPRKNIRPFCGKPMIAWSIETALASGCFDRVLVSTDDDEVAEVAEATGAEVPFRRPAVLADDHTGTQAVILHALQWCEAQGWPLSAVCCLYATAPFVSAQLLQQGLTMLEQEQCDYVFPVTSFPSPIQRALRLDGQARVDMFDASQFTTRSQDLTPAFHDAGQFYWGRADAWRASSKVFSQASRALVLPRHQVQDIDTEEDWTAAEWLFQRLRSSDW